MNATTTQLDAVRVLTGIIRRAREAGLPSLSWDVHPYDGAGLEAQTWSNNDDDTLSGLQAWADHLGAEIATTTHERYVSHEIRAEVDGVQIKIYKHTNVTYDFIQVDATEREAGR